MTTRRRLLAATAAAPLAPPAAAAAQSPRLSASDYLSVGATLTVKDMAKSALVGLERLLAPPGVPDGLAAVNVYANAGMLLAANRFATGFDNLDIARSSWAQFLAAYADIERFGTDLVTAVYTGDAPGVDAARAQLPTMLSRLDAALHAYDVETDLGLGT